MGTVFSFDIREPGVDARTVEQAVALLHDIDATFSTYRPGSVVSRLARGEIRAEDTSAEVQYVLAECARWEQATEGWFSAYAAGVLDPSGFVKGWAVQRVSDLLVAAGSTSHSVNGGGDVQCVGDAADGRPWRVGISDPADRTKLVGTVTGSDIAVATSGTSERGRLINDPHTGRPADGALLSLTVTGRSIVACDVYATAGFAMGAAARGWLAGLSELHALAVEEDGTTWSTFPGARGRGDGQHHRGGPDRGDCASDGAQHGAAPIVGRWSGALAGNASGTGSRVVRHPLP